MKKFLAKLVLITLIFSNFNLSIFNQTFAASPWDILITEVEYDPLDDNETEWFELYNPTSSSIDISNWTINEKDPSSNPKTYTFPNGTVIAANDFLVVTNDWTKFSNENSGVVADLEMDPGWSWLLKLNNNWDFLTLKDDSWNVIDHVAWEWIDWFDINWDQGTTVCRRNLNDTDSDSEWANNCTPTAWTGTFVTKFPGWVPVASLLWGKADSETYNHWDTVSTLHDRSGNNRDWTANNTPSFDTTNTINFYPTISFDGINDGIDFPRYSMPIADKNYTIFTVFKTDLSQNWYLAYVWKETTTNHNTRLFVNSDWSLGDSFENGPENDNISPAWVVKANKATLVSFNYNTNNNDKNIFVNGKM